MKLINRDKLCEYANNQVSKSVDANDIMRFPTVDAEPLIHGYWRGKPILGFCTVWCSVCGEPYLENDGRWRYCPNCGAKMDGTK